MVVSIHQPDYISYLGYFYKISRSDVFVFLDDAQFSNNNMHHWNRIKTPQGECRLKIPVEQHLGDPINTVRTKDRLKWKEKHLKTMEMNYTRARYFADIFPAFRELLLSPYPNLAEMNMEINTWIARSFGFQARIERSSSMEISTKKEQRVIDIVKMCHGDIYLSGYGAKEYQSEEDFIKHGIKLLYTGYQPITYRQLWMKAGFLPRMSVLDYLFNCGFDWEYVERSIEGMNHGNR